MNTESLRLRASEAVGNYLLENVHRVVYGKENLRKAREHLANGGSLIVEANHFAKLDPILYGRILKEYITSLDHVSGIGSRRHFDPKQGFLNAAQSILGADWEKIHGITIFQAVQERDHELYPDFAEFNSKMARKAAKKLRHEPGSVLFITPEGTRSKTDELLRAEEGLDILLRIGGENVLVLPLAAEHKTILPGRRTTVTAGELFGYQDLVDDKEKYLEYYRAIDGEKDPTITLSDCAMVRIGENLPLENQGFYADLVAVRRQIFQSAENSPLT